MVRGLKISLNFVDQKLQTPLKEREIEQLLTSLNINDKNFQSLFMWKNGFDFSHGEDGKMQNFDYGALLSIEYIKNSNGLVSDS